MKKLILLLCFGILPFVAACPPPKVLIILKDDPIYRFDPILWAFQKVESNFDTEVVNSLGYTGILQEGQEMINEANRICRIRGIKKHFTFPDSALDSLQSVQIWYVVQNFHNPKYQLKRATKIWNSRASERYYQKIKREISGIQLKNI